MTRLIIAAVVSCLALAGAAWAQVPFYAESEFVSEFTGDVEAGSYVVGASPRVEERFLVQRGPVVAEFQIEEARPSEDFGAGVGFFISNADGRDYVRVAFGDIDREGVVWFYASHNYFREDERISEPLIRSYTRLGPDEIGRVQLQLVGERHLVVEAGAERLEVELGFAPTRFLTQVYCAKGWIRFPQDDLIS